MDVERRLEARQEDQSTPTLHEELIERIARAVPVDGTVEPLEGLVLRHASTPTEVGHGVARPSFCVIAQGSKEVRLGDRRYRYDPAHYLIATTTVPVASRITEASPERPYLGVVLRLDPALVASVMVEAGRPARPVRVGNRRQPAGQWPARRRGATGSARDPIGRRPLPCAAGDP